MPRGRELSIDLSVPHRYTVRYIDVNTIECDRLCEFFIVFVFFQSNTRLSLFNRALNVNYVLNFQTTVVEIPLNELHGCVVFEGRKSGVWRGVEIEK